MDMGSPSLLCLKAPSPSLSHNPCWFNMCIWNYILQIPSQPVCLCTGFTEHKWWAVQLYSACHPKSNPRFIFCSRRTIGCPNLTSDSPIHRTSVTSSLLMIYVMRIPKQHPHISSSSLFFLQTFHLSHNLWLTLVQFSSSKMVNKLNAFSEKSLDFEFWPFPSLAMCGTMVVPCCLSSTHRGNAAYLIMCHMLKGIAG